jgi:hypothetical protein
MFYAIFYLFFTYIKKPYLALALAITPGAVAGVTLVSAIVQTCATLLNC